MSTRDRHIMWSHLFRLSRGIGSSLQQQIRETFAAAIVDGRLPSNTPVPSSRELARHLGIARNTVTLAYQRLAEDGFLIAEERRGYFINPEMRSLSSQPPGKRETVGSCNDQAETPNWDARFRYRPNQQRNISKPRDWRQYDYPFIYGQVDPEHFPINAWRECYRQALSVPAVHSLVRDRMDADDELLVEQIQKRLLPRRGVWVDKDQILITLGSQNALHILTELLVGPRHVVGIEDPGYPDARNIFSLKTKQLRPLPVDEHGLRVDNNLNGCDYVYVTPSHQSPTNAMLPAERREDIMQRAKQHDCVIIEDDYESENTLWDAPLPALKSMDDSDRVLYTGSLSKNLDPGLRVGFLVASKEVIREARALRRLMFRHPPANNQYALALFLALGHYDSLVQRMNQVYRERSAAMAQALREYLPEVGTPEALGGTAYWLAGPPTLDARELVERAQAESILLEPGDVAFFSHDEAPLNYFRLGFSVVSSNRIDAGIQRLSRLVRALSS